MIKITKAQHAALNWLVERNGTGLFTKASHYNVVMAGGEEGPFNKSTWYALRDLGLVEIETPPGRRITATVQSEQVNVIGGKMTFDQMLEAIKAGKKARHPKCSPGWLVAWSDKLQAHYWINPHTGSTPMFPFSSWDRETDEWQVVEE